MTTVSIPDAPNRSLPSTIPDSNPAGAPSGIGFQQS